MKNYIVTLLNRIGAKRNRILILVLVILLVQKGIGQSSAIKYGVSISRSSSGNSFGPFYNPGAIVKVRNNQFELAANIQQRNTRFSGAQFTHEYIYFGGDEAVEEKTQLFVFYNMKLITNASLNRRNAYIERRNSPESKVNFDNLRFTTMEAYIGFGLKLKLTEHLKLASLIGIGAWSTLSGESNLLCRDYKSMSLTLKIGVSYLIR